MVWYEPLGCVEGCAGCCGLSSPTGRKRDAENLSSQESGRKSCDKGSPEERGLTNGLGRESPQTEAGHEPCMGPGDMLGVGAISAPGVILQV